MSVHAVGRQRLHYLCWQPLLELQAVDVHPRVVLLREDEGQNLIARPHYFIDEGDALGEAEVGEGSGVEGRDRAKGVAEGD